jgi:spore maturation protein CgeB
MKILLVDLKYDYGDKNRGINEIGEKGFRQVFKKLGHEVECFYYDEFLNKVADLQSAVLAKAESFAPDLIYFILFGEQFSFETLDRLKTLAKTVNWFGDDQWRFESFTRKYAPHFSWSVTTDPFAMVKYRELGIQKVFLSQWAAMDTEILPAKSEYKYDVSFIGGSHSVRRWFVKELSKRGIDVQTFGYGWPTGPISLDKMAEIFATSKINLNLSNSITYDLRYLTDNLKNPIVAWRSKKVASQLKARNFEIPYFGGFEMTDYVPFLESYFAIGEEITCYRDIDEAAQLIAYYLTENDLREKIKLAGIAKARSRHTYLTRHREFFGQLA